MKIEEFLNELRTIKSAVNNLLDQRRKNSPGIGSIKELEFIVNELDRVESQLLLGQLPPATSRRLVSAHLVMENWPIDEELTNSIARLSFMFRTELDAEQYRN
jgi:hypothetical protein